MLVKNNEPRIMSLAGKSVLQPGVNEVPDDVWKDLQKHVTVKALVDAGTLEVMTVRQATREGLTPTAAPGTPGGTPVTELDINAVEPADAKRLAGETFDRALLQKWQREVKDKDVRGAIEKQLEATGLTSEEVETAKARKSR